MSDNLKRLLALDFDHPVFRTYPGGPLVDPMQMTVEGMQRAVSELDKPKEIWTDDDRHRAQMLVENAIVRRTLPKTNTTK